jgi:hypothetical protein
MTEKPTVSIVSIDPGIDPAFARVRFQLPNGETISEVFHLDKNPIIAIEKKAAELLELFESQGRAVDSLRRFFGLDAEAAERACNPICNTPHDGYRCTLPKGHSGDHVACSLRSHGLKRWPQIEEEA